MRCDIRTIRFVMLAATLGGIVWVSAGDLNPPAGPVAPTMKPLDEVEPRMAINSVNTPGTATSLFNISQPGSYYLTGNVVGQSDKHGISVTVSDVTLDLNGFALLGVAGSLDGIAVTGGRSSISIYNGTFAGWGEDGVDLTTAANCQLRNLRIHSNGANGLLLGESGLISECTVESNGINGIVTSKGCNVVNSTARVNINEGIVAGSQSTITDCTASRNVGFGIRGGFGCTIDRCTARENGSHGIVASTGSMITNCTAMTNTGDGVRAVTGSILTGNTCRSNGDGKTGAGLHVTGIDNRIEGNHLTNNAIGLDIDGSNNFVANNTVRSNTDNYDIVGTNFLNILLCQIPESIDWSASVTLAGSLIGLSGQHGITVNADDVTLDLNGFALIGVPGSLDGIHVPEIVRNLTVRNGGVRSWGEDGVDAANALSSVIENVRAFGNLGTGLKIGTSSTVRNSGGPNGGDGITTGARCMITNCMANGSSGNGIVAGPRNRVADCTANFNGLIGIQTGTGSIVSSCTAAENFGDGISMRLAVGCTVTGCTAVNNGGLGIRTGSAGTVVNCTAVDNTSDGIRTGDASTVVNCTSQTNGNDGIRAGVSSTILGCTAHVNDSLGITVGGGSTITASTANSNASKGILGFGTTVTSCTANGNLGLGIDCNLAVGNTAFNNNTLDIDANALFNNDCDNCSQP